MAGNVVVREYRDRKAFEKDAQRLSRDGWTVQSSTERTQRSGCRRIVLLGPLALIFHPNAHIVVTYQRAA